MLNLWNKENQNMSNLIKMMIIGYDYYNLKLHKNTHTHPSSFWVGARS